MEKQKNSIDDLFRKVLHDHEITPSERAKENFLKDVSEMKDKRWFRNGFLLYLAMGAIIILGGVAIYLFSHQSPGTDSSMINSDSDSSLHPVLHKPDIHDPITNTKQNININPAKRNPATNDQTTNSSDPVHSNNDPHGYTASVKKIRPLEKSDPPAKAVPNFPGDNQLNSDTDKNLNSITEVTGEKNGQKEIIPLTETTDFQTETRIDVQTPDTSKILKPVSSDTLDIPSPADLKSTSKRQPSNRDWYFSLGIQYTPEWMFNTIEGGKYVNNFGAEGIFTFGKYSVRTGLGLSITKGTNELMVEYNDYLGSYNKLDSMSFAWNGAVHDYIPIYYLKSQDVYDSLLKLEYPKVVKRYTYLQIPVIFGYDFLQSGRFSFGLRAGPVLSILLYSRQLSEEYDPGDKKVISINDISPEQVSLNWQFMGGISASVRLAKNLNFEIEPMAKYYFNSVFEKSEITKKPWSIGIRGAFIIKL